MGNPAVDAMLKVLEPLRIEFVNIKETLDAASGKQAEAKAAIIAEVKEQGETENSRQFVVGIREYITKQLGDVPSANYVVFADLFKEVTELVNTLAEGYIDAELSKKYKTVSGSSESLRAKAKEIREKFDALAQSVQILDKTVTVEDLPRLGSGGRPAGSGKHQVNKGKFTFLVNGVEQSATKLSTVLLTASAKCDGSGTNGSFSVKEFMEILKAGFPDLKNEYDGNWEIKLKNGNVLTGKREMEEVVEDGAEQS